MGVLCRLYVVAVAHFTVVIFRSLYGESAQKHSLLSQLKTRYIHCIKKVILKKTRLDVTILYIIQYSHI